MTLQAALTAQTDRTLAAIRERRRKGGYRITMLAPTSIIIADAIREEFGDDAATAGRVLASVAPQLDHLSERLRQRGTDMTHVPALLSDLLGLAAEELCRTEAGRG